MATPFEQQSAVRVLIVEDNDAQRQILTDLVNDEGFDPVACSNAAEALTQAGQSPFGVAILDQRLPEMSGTELLTRLRTMQRGLRSIIHTAYGSFESARDAVNLGAFAYVEKLGHPKELMRQVHRAAQAWMAEALQRSEAKYRQLVDSVQAIVWRSDPVTGRFRFVSQEAEVLLGYPVQQWLLEPTFWQDHIHPEDQGWVLERCAQATLDQQSHEFEYRMIAADGRIVWLHDFVNIIIEGGQPAELVGVMVDITERKRAAQALEESEKRYRTIVEHAAEAIVVFDVENGLFVDSNSNAELLYGLARDALHQTGPAAMSPEYQPDGRLSAEAARAEIMRAVDGEVRIFEWTHRNAQGRDIPCEVRLVRLPSADRVLVRGSVTDITERKRAREALRASEESFRLMFAHNPFPMWVYDRETRGFLDVNEAALGKYGYDRDTFLSMTIEDIRPAEDIPRFRKYLETVSERVQKVMKWHHQTADGTLLDVEITAHDLPYRGRSARLVLANDITDRKRLEKEILEISNREQRRIGQDLHDGLGQLLAGIGFRLAELEGDLDKAALSKVSDVAEIGQMVERAVAQTRALAHGLDPVNVEQQGLLVALHALAQSIEDIYTIACAFTCPAPVEVQDPEEAIHVYRIAQEAITNALKHAQASRIEITLSQTGGLVELAIKDDGVGLVADNPPYQGMGLRIMDYRARMIGATFEVRAVPGGGTTVLCRFTPTPVQQPVQ